jgi:dUTP pyrophosphatase
LYQESVVGATTQQEVTMPGHDTSAEIQVACLTPRAVMPRKEFPGDAGFDLRLPEDHVLAPGVPYRIDLEIVLQIPGGWYGQILGRSSVFQRGLSVHPGVIDSDYRGSVQLLVENGREEPVEVRCGERLAQLLILPVPRVGLRRIAAAEIESTPRGEGGFGSTGR